MSDQTESTQPEAASGHGGIEIKKLGFSLFLKMPGNHLECRCSYVPHDQGSMITRDELASYLKQYNIREGIDQQVFDDFVVKAAAGQQLSDVLLASGIAPVAGDDECIRFAVHPSSAVHSGDEETTNVDMHIVQTFINVSGGEEIGRIIPAGAGIPGKDIMGMPLAAQAGKPLKITIGK